MYRGQGSAEINTEHYSEHYLSVLNYADYSTVPMLNTMLNQIQSVSNDANAAQAVRD
jgi:hypothetical protein